MNAWLRTLLGLDEGEIPAGGETHWEFSNYPHGAWLVAAIAVTGCALALIVLLYRREKRLTPWRRATLTALRLGALALVVLILLNPRLLTEIHLEHPGRTLFLFDVSASMGQRDDYEEDERDMVEAVTGFDTVADQPSRADIALAAIQRSDLIERLEERNRVGLFAFGADAEEVGAIDTAEDGAPVAAETSLGESISTAIDASRRDPLAGVVVVTDGRSNTGRSAVEALRAQSFGSRAPIWAIGVGKSHVARNYAVEEVSVPPVVEVGYPAQIEAHISAMGIRGPVTVALYRSRPDGSEKERIEEREVVANTTVFETRLKFVDTPAHKGKYRYTVRMPRRAGEVEWRDNVRSARTTAAEEHRRVLLVAGTATPEYKFVRNFGLRDDGVQLSCWLSSADPRLQQDGDVILYELPRTDEDLRIYDAIILMDPDPEDLPKDFQRALTRFVSEDGGGLAYVAGEAFTPFVASDSSCSTLRTLLPVDLAASRPPRGNEISSRPWQATPTARGLTHPVCRLLDSADENETVWEVLPPFYWTYPTSRLRPAAVALLRSPRSVLAAIHRAGLGEVLFLGSDDFWRWRSSDVSIHERFWASAVRYLAMGKFQTGSGKVTVESDRDRYRIGDEIRITAHLVDGRRQPVDKPRVEVLVEASTERDDPDANPTTIETSVGDSDAPSRYTVALAPVVGDPGRYMGVLRDVEAGEYQARIDPEAESYFRVEAPTSEMEDPSPDFETLESLALESGGRLLTVGEIDELPALVPETKVTEVLGRRATPVWDSFAMIALFCGLLVVEWVLRKWWRLN